MLSQVILTLFIFALGTWFGLRLKRKSKEEIVRFLDKSCKEVIEPFINKCYDELAQKMNAYSNKMVMEREVIADVGVWTAKKRYMLNVHNSEGVQYDEPKMKIMGIETTRSSTPMVVRQKLKDAIKLVLTGTEEQVIDFVANFKAGVQRVLTRPDCLSRVAATTSMHLH